MSLFKVQSFDPDGNENTPEQILGQTVASLEGAVQIAIPLHRDSPNNTHYIVEMEDSGGATGILYDYEGRLLP